RSCMPACWCWMPTTAGHHRRSSSLDPRLKHWANSNFSESGPGQLSVAKEYPMSCVLVVDDSATVRNDVAGFLQQNGLKVITAQDGRDGLEQLKRNGDIRLVICDVNMPNMDGLTMVERSRSELRSSTPVIMLTTESCPRMKERGK